MTRTEEELLAGARQGDQAAFDEIVKTLGPQLHAHSYRMLGSLHDADDAVQEAFIRAWRGIRDFEGRSSLRSWMYRITTNVCLTMIQRRRPRVLPADHGPASGSYDTLGPPPAETAWIEPYPDSAALSTDSGGATPESRYEQRESVELAFVAAVQHLPGNERAALLLREVLGFSAREVAEMMETTAAAVNSALQRARRLVADRVAGDSQQATMRSLGSVRVRAMVDDYVAAFERRDVDTLISMLTDDVTWSMPPTPTWYRGIEAVRAFLVAGPLRTHWRHLPTWANGQAAVGCYAWDDHSGSYVASVLDVLTLRGERVADVTAFVDGGLFARFGLPDQLGH